MIDTGNDSNEAIDSGTNKDQEHQSSVDELNEMVTVTTITTTTTTTTKKNDEPKQQEQHKEEDNDDNSVKTQTQQNTNTTPSSATNTPTIKKNRSDFDFIKTIGKGSFGKVKLVIEKETGKGYAAKILNKKLIIKEKKAKYVNTEKTILDSLDHPNIVKLYYTFQDENDLYFILEYCPNGDLLDQIKDAGCFEIKVAQFYAAEIIVAIEYLHSKGIAHRDLKPENILLGKNMHLKISDFGSAKVLGNDPRTRSGSFCGTAEYVCPELLTEKSAGKQADIWSFGCIMYQLISGKLPFKGFNEYQTFQLIIKRELIFPQNFDPVAQDLINKLICLDPFERLSIADIKNHAFFEGIEWDQLSKQDPPVIIPIEPPSPCSSPNSTRKKRSMSAHTIGSPLLIQQQQEQQKQTIIDQKSQQNVCSPRSAVNNGNPATTTTTTSSNQNPIRPLLQRERSSTLQHTPTTVKPIMFDRTSSTSSTPPLSPGLQSPRVYLKPNNISTLDKEKRKQLKDQQMLELSVWNRFLLPTDEIILACVLTEKRTGLISKKRQLIITDTPRIFYVDPIKLIQKGEIGVDLSLSAQYKSNKHFIITSKGRSRHFYDNGCQSKQWVDMINDLKTLLK
ncbi:hypothetical protein CYY_004550 [Polysphondylium violaceum]|uniref:non-specific serine/threonine protein kinase n=1 Tax=Polysphondylium violaceum TaxID=133409 RepID=A0A8J4V512_9MYCE|nr:hypothetical protein CYY_004550 [Polysphondylium violaceum]